MKIILLDNTGMVVFQGGITSIPLGEAIIIEKSIEFFNDHSPCFIHRSAVMKRLYVELEDFLEDGLKSGQTEWLFYELPSSMQLILSGKSCIHKILYL